MHRVGSLSILPYGFTGIFVFCSTFTIAGSQTALGLAVLSWCVLAALRRVPPPRRTGLEYPLLVFVLVSIVAALAGERPAEGLGNLRNLLLASIPFVVAWTATDRRRMGGLYAVLLVSGAASAAYGIAVFLLHRGEGTLGRTPGPFSTAMTYGGILLLFVSVFAAVGIGPGVSRRLRAASLAGAALAAVALFFSFTRSAWIGCVVSLAVSFSVMRRRLLVPALLLLVVVLLLLPAPYRARVTSIWDPDQHANRQRIELLRGGLGIVRDHPVLGVGTMDLADVYRRYKPPGAIHVHGHMHNIFLQVAVTRGIVGLAAFCWLLVALFRLAAGNLRLDLPSPERAWTVGTIGALSGFVVDGLFDWTFGDAEIVAFLWAIVGAAAAIRLVYGGKPGPSRETGGEMWYTDRKRATRERT
ncbi:MAG: O-antigen ligase family protein [Candidatus Krumholzibacteriota bacterium]|nr:O-antigen ligase family protein [Candidatus Krumholzibacteriota bacterium]